MIDDSKSSLIQFRLRWLKVSFSMRQFVEMETLVSGVFITPSSFKAILCWNIWNLIIVRPCICREIVHEPEADAVSGLMKAHWKSLEGAFSNGMQTLSQSHWSFKLHPHTAWIQRPQTPSKQLVPTVQLLWSRRNCTNFYNSMIWSYDYTTVYYIYHTHHPNHEMHENIYVNYPLQCTVMA